MNKERKLEIYYNAYEYKDDCEMDSPWCMERQDEALDWKTEEEIIELAKKHYAEDKEEIERLIKEDEENAFGQEAE